MPKSTAPSQPRRQPQFRRFRPPCGSTAAPVPDGAHKRAPRASLRPRQPLHPCAIDQKAGRNRPGPGHKAAPPRPEARRHPSRGQARRHAIRAPSPAPPAGRQARRHPPSAKPGTTHPGAKPGTTHEQRDRRERFERARRESLRPDDLAVLYGWHTVKAALENPARRIRKFLATENAARRLAEEGVTATPELVRPGAIDERLAPDAVHQGLYLEADPLPSPELADDRRRARCWCSTRSPTRIMWARSCAPPPASTSRPWSPPRATARRRPARSPRPRPARWNMCRSSPCRTSRGRWRS